MEGALELFRVHRLQNGMLAQVVVDESRILDRLVHKAPGEQEPCKGLPVISEEPVELHVLVH